MIETDANVEGNSYPSSIVEQVWTTYKELGIYYRETSNSLFKEFLEPETAICNQENPSETARRYESTLEAYKEILKCEIDGSLWETVEQRFPDIDLEEEKDGDVAGKSNSHEEAKRLTDFDEPNRYLAVNVLRLVTGKIIKKVDNNSKAVELIVYEYLKDSELNKPNSDNSRERQNAK